MARKLTGQSFAGAIEFFETKRDGLISTDTFFSSLSLYCLNWDVEKVEALAEATGGSSRKHVLAGWVGKRILVLKPPNW